eukprot:TRINITY_DN12582_c0_g1_i1.p2 TRINITY_DN12582_c0_g1~~TRINITY_DN12582_c0_g1_i1.p2  ORF type:complete len:249 (-),score=71.56 TRINITY_DN12582_c0_g1_i1:1753-2499(-)
MVRYQHDNLIHMRGCCTTDPYHLCVVMEFAAGGTLSSMLKTVHLNRDQIIDIALGIARGMAFLHSHDVLHRDLKPANIMFSETGVVRIGDFGLSKTMSNTHTMTKGVGTWCFMAPEMLMHRKGERVGKEIDVFSFAMVLWQMLSGCTPYGDMSSQTELIMEWVSDPTFREVVGDDWDADLVDLLTDCWQTEATDRPTFAEIVRRLEKMEKVEMVATEITMADVMAKLGIIQQGVEDVIDGVEFLPEVM